MNFKQEAKKLSFILSSVAHSNTKFKLSSSTAAGDVCEAFGKNKNPLNIIKLQGRPRQQDMSFCFLSMLRPFDAFQINALLYHFPERAHVSQSVDMEHCLGHRNINFCFCSETTNSEPDGRVRNIFVRSDGSQHVTWFQGRRSACRTRRQCDILQKTTQKLQVPN